MADLKLALLLNAVSPAIGGVLVRGEKGTAKSTVVRGLAAILPPVRVVKDCRFSCDPADPDPLCPDGPHSAAAPALSRPVTLAELPVGATEDRLAGSLDIERALAHGVAAYQPGLLAAAHRGLLYVDEVNLLHDHLVDLLLDAAALGVSYVEREGISVRHAARFLLVGTMNPEEGELRPQLLDRFGLTVQVSASQDPSQRAEVVRRRLSFEADPGAFAERFAAETRLLAQQVSAARARLPSVQLPDPALQQICAVCGAFGVDGMRADLVTARTAIALAAWHGRCVVSDEDIRQAARLALPHRRRRDPFDVPGLDEEALEEALREASASASGTGAASGAASGAGAGASGSADRCPEDDPDGSPPTGGGGGSPAGSPAGDQYHDQSGLGGDASGDAFADAGASPGSGNGSDPASAGAAGALPGESGEPGRPGRSARGPDGTDGASAPGAAGDSAGQAAVQSAGAPFRARLLTVPGVGTGAPGRRSAARTPQGRTIGARLPVGRISALHLPATLRAAAPFQQSRTNPATHATTKRSDEKWSIAVAIATQIDHKAGSDLEREPRGFVVTPADLREAVRVGREGNLVLFVVDASGSMAARQRMSAVKGAVLSLLLDAYQRRDKVGLITFRGTSAELALPPTSSVEAGARRLTTLATGGRTPLAAGLAKAATVLAGEHSRDPARRPLLVIVTDGRATSGAGADLTRAVRMLKGVTSVVVDCESGPVRLGLAGALARMLGGTAIRLDELAAGTIKGVVRSARGKAA